MMSCRNQKSRTIRLLLAEVLLVELLFIVIALLSHSIFLPQLIGENSSAFTCFGGDSSSQLIPAISFLENNLLEGNLLWSWEYGLGGDVFSQFTYYYSTSPFFYFMFLAKLLCGKVGGGYYSTQMWRLIASIIKQVLCMSLMYLLIRKEKKRKCFAFISALLYGCSPWYIDNSFAFDFMTDAMIWPPLIVLAYNNLDNKKHTSSRKVYGAAIILMVVLALCIGNSFYFGYMICIFSILFALIFSYDSSDKTIKRKRISLKSFFQSNGIAPKYFRRIAFLACLMIGAVALSSVFFLPSIAAYFESDRAQVATTVSFFPSREFLITLPESFFFKGGEAGWEDRQNFMFPLILLLVPCISFKKADMITRKKSLLALFMLVGWTMPIVSSLMNGMSYPTCRWCFLIFFSVAYAFPNWLEAFVQQHIITSKKMCILLLVIILFYVTHDYRVLETGASFGALGYSDLLWFILQMGFILGIYALGNIDKIVLRMKKKQCSRRVSMNQWFAWCCGLLTFIFSLATILGMPYGPYAAFSGYRNNEVCEFVGNSETNMQDVLNQYYLGDTTSQESYQIINSLSNANTFFRVSDEDIYTDSTDQWGHGIRKENRSWLEKTHGISVYNSLIDKTTSQWIKLNHHVTPATISASQYRGFGHRLFLENIWGVRYKFNTTPATNLYGYVQTSEYPSLYENENALGLDFWYDSYIDCKELQNASYATRDAALMQAAIISEDDLCRLDIQYLDACEKLDDTISSIPIEPDSVRVSNAHLDNVDIAGGKLNSANLTVDDKANVRFAIPDLPSDANGEYLLSVTIDNLDGTSFPIWANGEEYWTGDLNHRWRYPTHEYVIRYPSDCRDYLEITFSSGKYQISNVGIEYSSYENLELWTERLNYYNLENLLVDKNSVSGTISNERSGILALSIPYTTNWTCYVDGENTDIIPVDNALSGVLLAPGVHDIKFVYHNKFLLMGLAISCLTILVLFVSRLFYLGYWKRA